jgi:hypothetical protein
MNEQIKQLWEEAAKTTQSDSWEEQTKFMERFAELIVKECVSIADEYDGVGSTIVGRIKKHFEVE